MKLSGSGLKKATVDDADLKKVILYCEKGCPNNVNRIEEVELKYFYKIKEEIMIT